MPCHDNPYMANQASVETADSLLQRAFGSSCSSTPGTDLTGDIPEDTFWQALWIQVVRLSVPTYNVPLGMVGRRFIATLAAEFQGIQDRKWNSERPLIFPAVILLTCPDVRWAKDIRQRILQRLDLWDQGKYLALVQNLELEISKRRVGNFPTDDDTLFRAFNARVQSGRLRSAVRYLTNRDGGGVLLPSDIDPASQRTVLEILDSKHPAQKDPPVALDPDEHDCFEPYDEMPERLPVDITAGTIEGMVPKLSGTASTSGSTPQICNSG